MKKTAKQYSRLMRKRAVCGFLFSLPFILGFSLFFILPALRSFYYAFCRLTASTDGLVLHFVGLEQFDKALRQDPYFLQNIVSALSSLCISLPSIIFFSLFIAVILNQQFKGRTVARVIFFLPVVLYSGVVLLNFSGGLYSGGGAINGVQGAESTGIETINLTDAILNNLPFEELRGFINSLVEQVNTVVSKSGIQILIFLSGLQTISPSVYEAADIEGTNAWEKFWKITFPMISPMILVNVIYTAIDRLHAQDNPVMSQITSALVYEGNYGYGAALNMLYTFAVLLALGVLAFAVNKMVFYEDR